MIRKFAWLMVVLAALLLTACGDDNQYDAAQGTESFVNMMSAEVSSMSSSATTTVTADMTMDWAERTFPELFPAETSERFPAIEYEGVIYNARAYVGLWETSYLGITADGRIFGLGAFTGGLLQQFETIDYWADQILASPSDSGSLQTDQWWHRTITVPAGTSQLQVYLTVPRGTVDLLLKHGQQPDEQMYYADGEDCYDWADPTFDGQCVIDAPTPGIWYISLWAVADSDFTLQISLTGTGDNGTDKDGLGPDPSIQASLISAAEAFGTGEPARFAPWLSLNLPVPDGAAPIPLEDAKKVGQAMKAATLIYASKYYAFYEMTIDGRNYPLTLVQEEQGQWKIDQM